MIELRDVSKEYRTTRGRKVIRRPAEPDPARRGKVGVLGRNGAGKSTLWA